MKAKIIVLVLSCMAIERPIFSQQHRASLRLGAIDVTVGMDKSEVLQKCPNCALHPIGAQRFALIVNKEALAQKNANCPPSCISHLGFLQFDAADRVTEIERSWGKWDPSEEPKVEEFASTLFSMLKETAGEGDHACMLTLRSTASPEGRFNSIHVSFVGEDVSTIEISIDQFLPLSSRSVELDERLSSRR